MVVTFLELLGIVFLTCVLMGAFMVLEARDQYRIKYPYTTARRRRR